MEGNYARQNEQCVTNAYPTIIHNVDGPYIDPSQIVSVALAEYQKTLSHTNDPDREVLACPKELSIGQFHFKFKREKTITVLEYIHSR